MKQDNIQPLSKKEYLNQYYQRNKKRLIKLARTYYKNNKKNALSWQKDYYNNLKSNPSKLDAWKTYQKAYHSHHKYKLSRKTYARNYQIRNADKRTQYAKKYYTEVRKIRYLKDPAYKLKHSIRSRLSMAVNKQFKTCTLHSKDISTYLGCSLKHLKEHIESLFKPGMSWDNHKPDGWHIDHIKPLASYDFSDPEQIKAACHYTNLQPLWAEDNKSKGCKIL